MIRKLLLLILLSAMFVCVGCDGGKMSTWVLTGQDTDLKTLVGYNAGVEFGGMATWTPTDDIEWGPEPTGVGFYIGADTTWIVSATDTPDPAPFPIDLLDGLQTVPYGRVEFLDDIENDNFGNLEPQWVGGTRFLLNEDGDISIVVEYSDGDQASGDIYIGGNIRF